MKNTHLNHYCECTPFTVASTLTPSYMLGSHIQKGLYNGFDDTNSLLTHDLYDSPEDTEVDPFSDVRSNKFDLYKLSQQAAKDDKSSTIGKIVNDPLPTVEATADSTVETTPATN